MKLQNVIVIVFIIAISGQSIYYHFQSRKLKKIAFEQLQDQKKLHLTRIDSLEELYLIKLNYSKVLIKNLEENVNKGIEIKKVYYEKKRQINLTNDADSLKRLITKRYR